MDHFAVPKPPRAQCKITHNGAKEQTNPVAILDSIRYECIR